MFMCICVYMHIYIYVYIYIYIYICGNFSFVATHGGCPKHTAATDGQNQAPEKALLLAHIRVNYQCDNTHTYTEPQESPSLGFHINGLTSSPKPGHNPAPW